MIRALYERNQGDFNAVVFSEEDSYEDLSKAEVITSNFREQADETNSSKSTGTENHPRVLKELIN